MSEIDQNLAAITLNMSIIRANIETTATIQQRLRKSWPELWRQIGRNDHAIEQLNTKPQLQ